MASPNTRISLQHDPKLVESQLKQMTLEEKVSLLGGSGFATTAALPRLGIQGMKITEGVNGVKDAMTLDSGDVGDVLAGLGPRTVSFPSTSCFGATWNADLMYELGEMLGLQAHEKDIATIMGPGVNLHRDPRGGRNFEYFSEDPLLSGQLAASLINGIQSQGVGACVKHFYANDADDHRRSYNVVDPTDGRALRELYLYAFQETLRYSNPVAVMTSYNKVQGVHTSETPAIKSILRDEWGYDGAVQSDWFGTVSTVESILAGQDLEMPGPPIFRGGRLVKAVQEGKVTEAQIDERARKMLEWINKVSGRKTDTVVDQERAIRVACKVASEGAVLLKNQNDALPLKLTEHVKLAVAGTLAVDPPIGGGGSSLAPPSRVTKPYECIRAMHPQPESVKYAGGVPVINNLPLLPLELMVSKDGDSGINVKYFNNGSDSLIFEEHLKSPQIMMLGHLKPGLEESNGFSYEMTTTITPKVGGSHTIGVRSTGAYKLYVDGTEVLSASAPVCNAEDWLFTPFKMQKSVSHHMKAGIYYPIKLVVQAARSPKVKANEPSPHGTALCFQNEYSVDNIISEAVSVAKTCDVSLVFAGQNSEFEAEGFDRTDINLPGEQTRLIKEVAAASKKTIVVLYSGGPLDISPFVDSVDAILHAHYLGQEGGIAIADIISGKTNPSGKLATTWVKRISDLLTIKDFPAKENADGQVELPLSEGLEVGYRRRDKDSIQYPLGFGLSYTAFNVGNLSVSPNSIRINETPSVKVIVTVTNTGSMAGAEVVQVYVSPKSQSLSMHPVPVLRGFKKIMLEPGASSQVTIPLELKRAFSYWDSTKSTWRVEKGTYAISVGQNSEVGADIIINDNTEWLGL